MSKQIEKQRDYIVTSVGITKSQYEYIKQNCANLSWYLRNKIEADIIKEKANEITPITESSFIHKDHSL